ncbi:MAG: Na/Pi symporter [Gammaproteobacteria bacterium]
MNQEVDLIGLIAGLGLFLYGMRQLESGLRQLVGGSFQRFLRQSTQHRLSSVTGGIVATAILQSSSLVGLIVLAFVGAGIIPLVNAIGIVLGSNLGTTLTGWIVTALGFRLELDAYALPILGISALGYTLLKDRWQAFCLFLIGLALIVAGLDFMKASVAALATQFDIESIRNLPLLVFLMAGVMLTAIIQSSSATMMITLSALHAELIPLQAAAAIVVGADLGTTSTVIIGSLQGAIAKRRVALAHFIFNLVVDVAAFVALLPLLHVVTDWLGLRDPLFSLVMFHSLFNLIGVIFFVPFLPGFAGLIERRVPERSGALASMYIHNVPANVTDAALEALRKESRALLRAAVRMNMKALGVQEIALPAGADFSYERLKTLEGEIVSFAIQMQQEPLQESQASAVEQCLEVTRRAVFSCKSLRDVAADMEYFSAQPATSLTPGYDELRGFVIDACRQVMELLDAQHTPGFIDEAVRGLSEKLTQTCHVLNDRIYDIRIGEGVSGHDISTMLNTTREIYNSALASLEACQKSYAIDDGLNAGRVNPA